MPRIDVSAKVELSPDEPLYLEKKPESGKEERKMATVRDCLMGSLLTSKAAGDADGRKKFEYASLAVRLWELKPEDMTITLTVEEMAELKKLSGDHFIPWIVYQVWNAIEKVIPEPSKE